MGSWDTRNSGSVGYAPGSQRAICWGDHRSASFASTSCRKRGQLVSLAGLGRRVRSEANPSETGTLEGALFLSLQWDADPASAVANFESPEE